MQQPTALISFILPQRGRIVSEETASCDINTWRTLKCETELCEIEFPSFILPIRLLVGVSQHVSLHISASLFILKQRWHVKGCRISFKLCGIVEKVRIQT